jgi:hypothetical protein
LVGSGDRTEAAKVLRETLGTWRSAFGEEYSDTLRTADNLAEALTGEGHHRAAVALATETFTTRTRPGSRDLP